MQHLPPLHAKHPRRDLWSTPHAGSAQSDSGRPEGLRARATTDTHSCPSLRLVVSPFWASQNTYRTSPACESAPDAGEWHVSDLYHQRANRICRDTHSRRICLQGRRWDFSVCRQYWRIARPVRVRWWIFRARTLKRCMFCCKNWYRLIYTIFFR